MHFCCANCNSGIAIRSIICSLPEALLCANVSSLLWLFLYLKSEFPTNGSDGLKSVAAHP